MRTFSITTLTLVLVFVTTMVKAQARKETNDHAVEMFSGCYQTGIKNDGFLKLNSDGTFSWTKDRPRNGTWRMKKVFGIPFSAEIIILKYEDGKKEKYEIDSGGNTGKKAIELRGEWLMKEIACK